MTTSGQVISGAGSPGQQVWIGSRPRSMSAPFSTTSWHGAPPTVFGLIDITVFTSGSSSSASRQPRGGSGWRRKASSLADLAQLARAARSMPQATRSTVPNRLTSTGIALRAPSAWIAFSNSTAGPRFGQQPGLDLGHLQHGRDRLAHPHEAALAFEPRDEVAQGGVGHDGRYYEAARLVAR